jgi:hypothetical protein
MKAKVFTHEGVLVGDARSGGREFKTKLRQTPSGSHWVDERGRKYRLGGGGYAGERWPMWHLRADTIRSLASGMETATADETAGLGPKGDSPAPQGDAQEPSHDH